MFATLRSIGRSFRLLSATHPQLLPYKSTVAVELGDSHALRTCLQTLSFVLYSEGRPRSLFSQGAFTEQSQSVSQQGRQQQGPDISLLNLKLQQQWDHAKNAHLGDVLITPHSPQKVQWTCPDCLDGHAHTWEVSVNHRTKCEGCPFCLGKRVCQHNSVATRAPNVAASWDSTANDGIPHDFTANSNHKKQWHCHVCGHRWVAQILSRVAHHTGCPACHKLERTRPTVRRPTLAECNHPLLKDWDTESNAKEGLLPDKLTLGSHKRVHWVCHKCPLGLTHKYTSSVNSRALAGSGCSICHGFSKCKCNSLPSLFPDLAQEWDNDKNDQKTGDYTAKSHAMVWWKSEDRQSWQQSINSRTDRRLKATKNPSSLTVV